MWVTFDTEFIDTGREIELISLGAVREDGEEYYAEVEGARLDLADEWVRDNVLVHLTGMTKPRCQIAQEFLEFAGPFPDFWAYYADYDWVVLNQLYGPLKAHPRHWPMYCNDIIQEWYRLYTGKITDALPQDGDEHHALADARWNAAALTELILI